MQPRLLNLAAGVSLLLAIAIVALWVRSYGRDDVILRVWHTSTEGRGWNVQSYDCWLRFQFVRHPDKGHSDPLPDLPGIEDRAGRPVPLQPSLSAMVRVPSRTDFRHFSE